MAEQGFSGVFEGMIPEEELTALCAEHEPVARRSRKRETRQLVGDLVFHQLHQSGTLAEHGARLGGERISDSAYAQRRALLPQELFDSLLAAGLAPLADPQRHPDGFYRGWRLIGVDGTEASVTNTPANTRLRRAASRRGQAAFAKLKLVTAMELGLHNPLAAESGELGDYEVKLALRLWSRLPEHSLVIIDRLYGAARHVAQMQTAGQGRDLALLVRVRGSIKARVLENLGDGSRLVEVRPTRRKGEPAAQPITVREIRARVRMPGGREVSVRLWTTLVDATAYPALELAQLYVVRWEHELSYRELKLDVRDGDVLESHTPETALQELAAIVLALAVTARLRAAATEPLSVPARRISLRKLLLATASIWEAFALAGRTLTVRQKSHMLHAYFARLQREAILPKRRPRHCPRAIRQPVSGWPRLQRRSDSTGPASVTIVI